MGGYGMVSLLLRAGGGNPLDTLVTHVLDHDLHWNVPLIATKHQLLIVISAILLMVVMVPVCSRSVTVPTGFRNAIEAIVQFLRTSVIKEYIHGEDARRFTPYFLTVFFFILTLNLLGMIPKSASATGNIAVTAALSLCTFAVVLIGGMIAQGPVKFWVNLVPGGVPPLLVPLIFLLEVVSLISKHFALTIRLMANMTAGHVLLGAFIAFCVVGSGAVMNFILVVPASLFGGLFIGILEVFVAFLQAYIFTFLSAVFVGAALHPDH